MRTIFSLRACVACVAVAVMGFTFVACGDDGSSTNFEERRDPAASCDGEDCDCGDGGDCEESSSSKKAASSSSATAEERTSSSEKAPPSSSSKKDEKPSSSSSADQSSSSEADSMACDVEGRILNYINENKERIRYICIDGYYELFIRSSSSRSLSSSSYFDMSKQYNRNYSYGEFTDPRDGQVYKTVKHYDGYWTDTLMVFAANLNYGKMVTTSTIKHDDNIVEKICFNDDPWYCENGFGGLYSWSEAMDLPNACDTVLVGTTAECNVKPKVPYFSSSVVPAYDLSQHQGICPEGWHIMNEHEWRAISYEFSTFGIISEIFGSEDRTFTGFSLLLGGVTSEKDDKVNFLYLGEYSYFTLPEEKNAIGNRVILASKLDVDFSRISVYKRTYVSVRCVKDYEAEMVRYSDE